MVAFGQSQLGFDHRLTYDNPMADFPRVTDFEIRLHKADGTVSIIMRIVALGVHGAKIEAAKMLKDDLAYAVIRQGLVEVATVHRHKPH
jgi:hypothetical protein